jgi:hypothetical protein
VKRLAFLICLFVEPSFPQTSGLPPSAREVWERAVEAKGGRDRLNSIENVLTQGRYRGGRPFVYLHVFPDRYWEYDDRRPLVFGISVRVGWDRGQWTDSTAGGGAAAHRNGRMHIPSS